MALDIRYQYVSWLAAVFKGHRGPRTAALLDPKLISDYLRLAYGDGQLMLNAVCFLMSGKYIYSSCSLVFIMLDL